MVKYNCMMKSKFGFSLMEACVVMLIASIFIVVMANVIPRKVSKKSIAEAHGRFECYYDDAGNLWQEEFNSGASATGNHVASAKVSKVDGAGGADRGYCEFQPNKYAKYYIINVVGAGAKGDGTNGGNAGRFSSMFMPAMTKVYWLFPGRDVPEPHPAGWDSSVGDSYVTESGSWHSGKIVASGGQGSSIGILGVDINDINECSFTETTSVERYNCGRTPTCKIIKGNPGTIQVYSCVNQEKYSKVFEGPLSNMHSTACQGGGRSLYDPLLGGYISAYTKDPTNYALYSSVCYYDSIAGNPWLNQPVTGSYIYPDVYIPKNIVGIAPHLYMGGKWIPKPDYEKAPSLYRMLLKIEVEADGATGAVSKMSTMADVFEFSADIQEAGNGGDAAATHGHPGAIVITW